MIGEIGQEHYKDPAFQEAYGYGLDLWGDIFNSIDSEASSSDDRFTMLMTGGTVVKDDIEELFRFTEGTAEMIMQKSFRDIAESRGIIKGGNNE